MNQITIGRNSQCTLVVAPQYKTVSGTHATITYDGNHYILQDHSLNGTYVNGVKIHNSSYNIHKGDTITLGQQYQLSFSHIQSLFSTGHNTVRKDGTQPVNMGGGNVNNLQQININVEGNNGFVREEPKCLHKWNWGAFFWGWIWGVGNGVYWPLITLIPYVGQVAALIIIFILGANGSQYAWEKFSGSASEFDEKQHNWAVAAGIAFFISIAIIVIAIIAIAAGA